MCILTPIGQVNGECRKRTAPTFHVGVIMDGNGRWAEARGLGRVSGHVRGARRVTEIVKACPALGVTHLTLYAFSTENWQRPLAEVEGLMRIFGQYILQQDGRAAAQRRAGALHRHAPPGAAAAARADGGAGGAHAGLPRAEPLHRHRLRRARRADPGGQRAVARGGGGAPAAGGDLARRRSRRRSTPAGCRTRTSSSAPRGSCGSRTSCSGRAPTPSTTFPRPLGPISPPGISARRWRRSGCGGGGSAPPIWRSGRARGWPERRRGRPRQGRHQAIRLMVRSL